MNRHSGGLIRGRARLLMIFRVSETQEAAQAWLDDMRRAARGGVDPDAAMKRLAEYGTSIMDLAIRGLERKTLDPYLAGWRKRVVPTLGHIPVRMITNGAVDRAVYGWIADECSRSTVKNSLRSSCGCSNRRYGMASWTVTSPGSPA